MGFLESLQNSGFATWVRESPSLLAYQLYITLHTIGLGMIVGVSVGVCLRVLGVTSALPLAPMEKYLRFMWLGFWISLFSGLVLFILEPGKFLTIPVFYIKLASIVVALVMMSKLSGVIFRGRTAAGAGDAPAGAKGLAVAVILSWFVGILAGRVTAYSPLIQI